MSREITAHKMTPIMNKNIGKPAPPGATAEASSIEALVVTNSGITDCDQSGPKINSVIKPDKSPAVKLPKPKARTKVANKIEALQKQLDACQGRISTYQDNVDAIEAKPDAKNLKGWTLRWQLWMPRWVQSNPN